MNQFVCCLKKDFTEIRRTKKIILLNGLLVFIGIMVLGTTLTFPALIEALAERRPDIISEGSEINRFMAQLFPQSTKENLGIYSSDVAVFFTIAISFICSSLLPSEINSGKWILVSKAGYKYKNLFVSKVISYGMCASLSVLVMYNLYYTAAKFLLNDNFTEVQAVLNSVILAFAVFSVTNAVIALSLIYKNHIMAAITIIAAVFVLPDILTMFSFGEFFPTYLLTFVYNSSSDIEKLFLPVLTAVILQICLDFWAVKKLDE